MTFLVVNNEAARLNALRDMRLLDTPPSESFDRLTRMASKLLGAPVSTISLTDGDRQWFKSRVGVDLQEIPREQAPCSYAIQSDQVFVVPDLATDERFKMSPLVQAGIRFYAGAPLITRSGFGLGTICVVDDKPRTIGLEEERVLRDLAGLVMAQIDIQNMIGRVDATTGQANEHQFHEDLADLATTEPEGWRAGLLVELASPEQVSHGLRVLGGNFAEQVVRAAVSRLRATVGNAVRLYQVGPSRCLAIWDELMARDAEEMMDAFAVILRDPVLCSGIPIVLDAAMGLHRFRLGDATGSHVIRCLFNAVDDARRNGEDRAIYSEAQDRVHARSFCILNDVPKALRGTNEFRLVYQPRIDMPSGRCVGAEALLRWTHPTLGPLSPGEFVPLIEQTEFIDAMTDWVLDAAIGQVAVWRTGGVRAPCVSINASAYNLEAPGFVTKLAAVLERHGVAPAEIELEFTESALAGSALIIKQLEAVRDMGMAVAIDDFGTGYSNLGYLKRLPASVLKIDRSFIMTLGSDERDRRLVKTMIDMAHDLEFRVVAEGIETQEAYDLLRLWNCDEGQGYLMARPMAAADFERWLAAEGGPPIDKVSLVRLADLEQGAARPVA